MIKNNSKHRVITTTLNTDQPGAEVEMGSEVQLVTEPFETTTVVVTFNGMVSIPEQRHKGPMPMQVGCEGFHNEAPAMSARATEGALMEEDICRLSKKDTGCSSVIVLIMIVQEHKIMNTGQQTRARTQDATHCVFAASERMESSAVSVIGIWLSEGQATLEF